MLKVLIVKWGECKRQESDRIPNYVRLVIKNGIKYGTSNVIQIYFQMEGLSQELSKKLINDYSQYILPKENGEYNIDKIILDNFKENEILKVELNYYL